MGGTGRSGTTVTARLLGSHPSLTLIPYEVRFIGAAGGLGDLLAGHCSLEGFVGRLRGPWYRRGGSGRGGLHRLIEEDPYAAAVGRFVDGAASDLARAAGGLVADLLDPLAEAGGWVEHTPEGMRVAAEVGRVVPDARWINVVRDGRDVAASVVAKPWGPHDPVEAVRWWARRVLRGAHAAESLGDRVLTVRLERLVSDHDVAASLFDHVGLEIGPTVQAYLTDHVTEAASNTERWRSEPRADEIDRAYQAARAWLVSDPVARGVDALLGPPVGSEGLRREIRAQERWVEKADRADARRLRRLDRRASE